MAPDNLVSQIKCGLVDGVRFNSSYMYSPKIYAGWRSLSKDQGQCARRPGKA